MRIIGLDLGTKRVGIALSDGMGWTASGLETFTYSNPTEVFERVNGLVDEYNVEECVIGFPLNMNGTVGKQGEFTLSFLEKLKNILDIPCRLWDERLSSISAERILIQADLSRKKRKKVIDKMAATIILQSFLDSRQISTQNNQVTSASDIE